MRLRHFRGLSALLALGLVAFGGCDRTATTAPRLDADGVRASEHANAPGAALEIPFSVTQPGDDPCTEIVDPNEHQVTFSGTVYLHNLPNGNVVLRRDYTVTTTSGYEGQGKIVEVANGTIYRGHFNDMVRHPDGRQFRAHAVHVVDLKTGITRVLKVNPLTCVKT